MRGLFTKTKRMQVLLLAVVAGEAGVIAYQAAPGEGSAGPAKPAAVVKAPALQAPWIQRNTRGHAGDFSGVLVAKRTGVELGRPGPVGP